MYNQQSQDLRNWYSAIAKMPQARQMIRGYTLYALRAFKDFQAAEI